MKSTISAFVLPHLRKFIISPNNNNNIIRTTVTTTCKPQILSEVNNKGMNAIIKVSEEEALNGLTTTPSYNNNNSFNTKVIHLLQEQDIESSEAKHGAQLLQSGGVIGVPTDTVYGIAANAQNNEAIARIYTIKGRDCRKPIAICVSSIEEVYLWGKVGSVPKSLLEDLFPGPVTLVFERQSNLNPNLNPSTNLIGIRIPDNRFIVDLAKFHRGPIALTSANPSACPSTLEVEEFKDLWPSLDAVFDGGRLSSCEQTEKAARAGSTVIDLSINGYYRIIREGTAHAECVQILQDKYKFKKHLE